MPGVFAPEQRHDARALAAMVDDVVHKTAVLLRDDLTARGEPLPSAGSLIALSFLFGGVSMAVGLEVSRQEVLAAVDAFFTKAEKEVGT